MDPQLVVRVCAAANLAVDADHSWRVLGQHIPHAGVSRLVKSGRIALEQSGPDGCSTKLL